MNVLQCVENHVQVDITRIFNNVLLQQTQQTDSNGEPTIASAYTQWYSDIFLRRVSAGHICFSPSLKAFVSLTTDGAVPFNAEEFSDPSELGSLVELIGPYGIRLLNENLMWHVGSQVQELKKIVLQNKDVLIQLRTNFDKPEKMKELAKRLNNVDSVLQRMTMVGVILSFRELLYSALNSRLEERIPFLYGTIEDLYDNSLQETLANGGVNPAGGGPGAASHAATVIISELGAAAGFSGQVDPLLMATIQALPKQDFEEEYLVSCLLMVFVAVTIPKLARSESSLYRVNFDGHENNIHCLATAVNQIFGVLFAICGHDDIEDRLKEFLALASSSLLRLAQPDHSLTKEDVRNRESVYILLDLIVQNCPRLSMDLLESCFPYTLLRNSYHIVHKMGGLNLQTTSSQPSGSMAGNLNTLNSGSNIAAN